MARDDVRRERAHNPRWYKGIGALASENLPIIAGGRAADGTDIGINRDTEVGKEVAMMWGNHWMIGGYSWIVWLAVLAVVIYLIKTILQSPSRRRDTRSEAPMEILKKRYAHGDISKDEFEERKKALSA